MFRGPVEMIVKRDCCKCQVMMIKEMGSLQMQGQKKALTKSMSTLKLRADSCRTHQYLELVSWQWPQRLQLCVGGAMSVSSPIFDTPRCCKP